MLNVNANEHLGSTVVFAAFSLLIYELIFCDIKDNALHDM